MNTSQKRATLKDVAAAAGVSLTTASQALNNKGVIAASTRERVRAAAADLGYRPNAVAQGLRKSKLGIIALVMRPLDTLDTFHPEGVDYFLRFTGSAALAALQHGYSLMLISDPRAADAPASSLVADGYIIADPVADDPVVTFLAGKRIPLVTVGVDPKRANEFPAVTSDTRQETRMVLEHLESRGAKRIALVTGTDQNDWNLFSEESYRAWCEEHGHDPVVIARDETLGVEGGAQAMREIADLEAVDAVYCLTGRHAAGLTHEALRLGIDVPSDLLVVSGSDSEQTRTMTPNITSLDLVPTEMGAAAVERLVNVLAKNGTLATIAPAAVLVERQSTANHQVD